MMYSLLKSRLSFRAYRRSEVSFRPFSSLSDPGRRSVHDAIYIWLSALDSARSVLSPVKTTSGRHRINGLGHYADDAESHKRRWDMRPEEYSHGGLDATVMGRQLRNCQKENMCRVRDEPGGRASGSAANLLGVSVCATNN